ncbi:hypothetical protein VPH35_140438 [Triticum aestivum]
MRTEKCLNDFVRFIALLERMGNGIGTRVFIWGTVVVLGDFLTYLANDLWVFTVIVFMEGFSPILFKTSVCLTHGISILDVVITLDRFPDFEIFILLVLLVIIHELGFYTLIGYMSSKESHTLLQFCPGVDYSFIPLWFSIYMLGRFGSPGENRELSISWQSNLQIPMALARIQLLTVWVFLNPIEVVGTLNENIKIVVKFLYIRMMCQGILYLVGCMLESLSFLFRRSLALDCDLIDKSGMKSAKNLFDTTKKTGLVTFAVESLNLEASREKKHAAFRILDSFLQKHKTSTLTTLINMLGWTVTEDADTRLFATKVIAHISPYLHNLRFPGAMQKILDDFEGNVDDQQISHGASSTVNGSRRDVDDRQQTRIGTSNSLLDTEEGTAPGVQGCSLDKDSLPALGMEILEGLAHDLHNYKEINRAKELLPKIIGNTAGRDDHFILDISRKASKHQGRNWHDTPKELSRNLMLISNLTEILEFEGISSYPEQSRLVMHIIAKIATHKKTRYSPSYYWQAAEAGEALMMLAMDCPGNSYGMLNKTNCEFIGDLASKLRRGQHIYQAVSLLHTLCENSRHQFRALKAQRIDWITDAEGKQMKALIGLILQICSIMSGGIHFIMELFQNEKALVKKLVGEVVNLMPKGPLRTPPPPPPRASEFR